jgi:ammonium transporter, Amt family
LILLLWLGLNAGGQLRAQPSTNTERSVPDPTALETPGQTARLLPTITSAPMTNAIPDAPAATVDTPPPVNTPPPANTPSLGAAPPVSPTETPSGPDFSAGRILAALLTFGGLGGFLLYHCGLTRAKNCGHTSVLILFGAAFGLIGYWMGGFAVQTGGIGDAHAALAGPLPAMETGALDHELGFPALGHHWGIMGSSGFFLMTDETAREEVTGLFLGQAALLALAVAAALGAALERGRLLAMAVVAFLTGAVIFPLFANWVWGGGWLAQLGRESGLGHGCVDLAGAGVVHETAGTLALVIALALGARQGRFKTDRAIPGHHVPFTILGALGLVIAFTASNELTGAGASGLGGTSSSAAVNVLLGAMGGTLISILLGIWRKQRPVPARLCRGLLGGAVSLCGGSALFDPWAAFLTGIVAGLLIDFAAIQLERRRLDDPVGAISIHGVGGAWGLLAVGLFANGSQGQGMNGVPDPVRGVFFGGAGHQLAAQVVGCLADFALVFGLGYASLHLVQKILGNRVPVAIEIQGLDWAQVGALGYQPDVEPEEVP